MKDYLETLKEHQYTWLVTGAAGFIGSNLVEQLLRYNQIVVGIDNLSAGYKKNIEQVKTVLGAAKAQNLTFVEGDIRSLDDCHKVCDHVDFVLHHAALASVPVSIEDPIATNTVNVDGFLNMLVAAREANVKRFIYASSCATYGDHAELPISEQAGFNPLSPYAVSKCTNELYAEVFAKNYRLSTIGLRYFNIFGPRQDPKGAYAAVIPLWISALLKHENAYIYGDGETLRDFCYVEDVVQANILAALTQEEKAINQVYNVASNNRCTLNELFQRICLALQLSEIEPVYRDFRTGDIRRSYADIDKAKTLLGYDPNVTLEEGLAKTVEWYGKF